jgi:16S rRNA (guanine(966)-N(2))-methyltransferase RsmD
MRIITGLVRGMPLAAPRSRVRPTSDRVRGAIFSILGDRVVDARVVDLFAGTGALGLEAASRGAAAVTFVENAAVALECLERNVERFTEQLRTNNAGSSTLQIERNDVSVALGRMVADGRAYSLIFGDPPYGDVAQELLRDARLPRVLANRGLFVLESSKREALSIGTPWRLVREAIYGDTRVSVLQCEPETSTSDD